MEALLIVDVQNDFLPGGKLAVSNSDKIIPVINQYIERFEGLVYASYDWHPKHHISFDEWPEHCIQFSDGAKISSKLNLPEDTIYIAKGTNFMWDQYSAFDNTGLHGKFCDDKITTVYICGLALDVCVFKTICDSVRFGIDTKVILAGTAPITEEGGRKALDKMMKQIIEII